jgi:hypothetical protein
MGRGDAGWSVHRPVPISIMGDFPSLEDVEAKPDFLETLRAGLETL